MINSNFAIIAVIVVILGLVALKIWRDYKSADKCASCPYAHTCPIHNKDETEEDE